MATGNLALGQEQGEVSASARVTNDFSINVATVNGSGSQSANSVLLKSIFGMGVPVSGKNLFPSNIAGLPTWYTIRASKDGYVARKRDPEVLVALNPETAREDVMALPAGGVAIYEENLNLKQYREDVVFYPVPFDKITAAVCPESKLRKLVNAPDSTICSASRSVSLQTITSIPEPRTATVFPPASRVSRCAAESIPLEPIRSQSPIAFAPGRAPAAAPPGCHKPWAAACRRCRLHVAKSNLTSPRT